MDEYADHKTVATINQELRKNRRTFALPDNSGHVMWQMDALSYYAWTAKYPELAAHDPQICRNAWIKFLNSDEGARYKINPYEGKRTFNVPLVSK